MKRNLTILILSLVLLVSFSALVSATAEPPGAPSNLSATADSHEQITLRWTKSTGDVDSYRIERSREGGSFSLLTHVGSDATDFRDDTGLAENTLYTYRVYAFNKEGGYSDYAQASATTKRKEIIPERPTNLSAKVISSTRISLEWRDNSDNEKGFSIERKKDDGSFREIATIGAGGTSYDDTRLDENAKYTYRVRAYNDAGYSSYSNEAEAVTATIPSAPTDLKAETVTASEIKLTWRDRSDNETGFKIERKRGDGRFEEIDTVRANVTSYSDTGLAENTKYTYRVRAYNAAGNSSYSNEASATTGRLPSAPTNLKAEATSNREIRLTWTDRSDNETGFRIERKREDGSFAEVATVRANVTSYSDSGLVENTRYTYRVRAYNAAGNSSYSNEASATTRTLPNAPTNLRALTASEERINLTWTDRSGDETGFKIERRIGGGRFVQIATVGANVTTYADRGLEPGTTYSYRVRAYNDFGNSDYTNEAVATTLSKREVLFTIGESTYYVNGLRRTMDTTPIIVESRTLLPVRFAAESLGARVSWDGTERKVTITQNRNVVELWIDENMARVNGRGQMIDPDNPNVKPIVVAPGRTMLPLRFIGESLGYQVDWDAQTREVRVTYVH